MGRYICHHEGRFFEWSTVVDAPVSHAMIREDFEAYYLARYGSVGLADLPPRLERAIAHGTSSFDGESLEDLIVGNRAGPDESEATLAEILRLVADAPA